MRVMSWNVDGTFPQAGSPDQIRTQVDWIASLDDPPDVLMLQEVNLEQGDLWHELLSERLGYDDWVDTLDLGSELDNSNGHVTAVRGGWGLSENKFGRREGRSEAIDVGDVEMDFPEKILITDLDHPSGEIELLNVRAVPGGSYGVAKLEILETVYEWIAEGEERPRILAGDLNTPVAELEDGQAVTFADRRTEELRERCLHAELAILKGLGHFGLIDVFRSLHGFGELPVHDVSHDGRRVDHLFASRALAPVSCRYPSVRPEHSDHDPVVAEFDP